MACTRYEETLCKLELKLQFLISVHITMDVTVQSQNKLERIFLRIAEGINVFCQIQKNVDSDELCQVAYYKATKLQSPGYKILVICDRQASQLRNKRF